MWFDLDEFNYISFYFDLNPSFDPSSSLKSISYQVYLSTKIVDVNFGYKKSKFNANFKGLHLGSTLQLPHAQNAMSSSHTFQELRIGCTNSKGYIEVQQTAKTTAWSTQPRPKSRFLTVERVHLGFI